MAESLKEVEHLVAGEMDRNLLPGVQTAARAIRQRHGPAVAAILFYGSCLRDGIEKDRLIDFYVFTHSLSAFHGAGVHALLNALLPPNVYYIEAPFEGRKVRSKYAVMSLDQLQRQTHASAFFSTLWARLSQPCALVFVRDDGVRVQIISALSHAIATTCAQTAPLFSQPFSARELWTRAMQESYRTEFRSEGSARAAELYDAGCRRFDEVTELLAKGGILEKSPASGSGTQLFFPSAREVTRALHWRKWKRRRVSGKILQIFRLAKATLTFEGGLDYILYKIAKHSGHRITVTDWQRRHPLLAAPALAWRLYRRGAFH